MNYYTLGGGLFLYLLALSNGAVISGTNIVLNAEERLDYNYTLTVYETEATFDAILIFFNVEGTTLKYGGSNLDSGSERYLTQFGDTFPSDNILDGDFPQLLRDGFDISTPTFYLSVNADNYTDETFGFRKAFGWAQFQFTEPGKIAMLDNAVSCGNGIIVGTTDAIPEPTTSGLALLASMLLLRRRRLN